MLAFKKVSASSSATRAVCFNRPLLRPNNQYLFKKLSEGVGDLSRTATFSTQAWARNQSPFNSFLFPRTTHHQSSSSAGSKSSTSSSSSSSSSYRSKDWSKTHQQHSHGRRHHSTGRDVFGRQDILADTPYCLGDCGSFVYGQIVMMDTMRSSDETWRRLNSTLFARKRPRQPQIDPQGPQQKRDFHSSSKREGWPAIWSIAAMLKSSGALSAVQVVGRIALTLLPMAVIKRSLFKKLMKHLPVSEHPTLANMHKHMQSSINFINIALWGLLIIPGSLFVATLLASLERTPITGRWRLILLSPEEEKGVATDLAGEGWRDAVANILTEGETEPLPRVIPLSDWRTQWVLQTWRHLESVVPLLQSGDEEIRKIFQERAKSAAATISSSSSSPSSPSSPSSNNVAPFPPPSDYPLMPRPRATTLLHAIAPCMSDLMDIEDQMALAGNLPTKHHPNGTGGHTPQLTSQDPPAHAMLGPPYSLLLVEKPQSANAFSYGFGPNGAGGVVVFSGFIDEILRKTQNMTAESAPINSTSPNTSGGNWSLLSWLTGTEAAPPSPPRSISVAPGYVTPAYHTPTAEQTNLLAILLAHEMAHLILSHHLETLSSNSILVPTVVGMVADLARTLAFPFTLAFGPFVNDALWEVSKFGTGEVVRNSEACRVKGLEVEADLVGARLLAYAGFDARSAVQFWEEREATETCAEITSNADRPIPLTPTISLPNSDGTKPQPSILGQLSEYPPFSWVGQSGEMAGNQPFGSLELQVAPPVLIPRPETEEWTYELLNRIKKNSTANPDLAAGGQSEKGDWKILDMCTGTGCIPLLLLNEWSYSNSSSCVAYGVDVGEEAVLLAQANAETVLSRFSEVPFPKVSFQAMKMDILGREFEEWLASQDQFDVLTSNPPYITDMDWAQLDRSVKAYEDPKALRGGTDGLDFYRRIAQLLYTHQPIRSGGYLALEFGKGQGPKVKKMIESTKLFADLELWTDAFDVERTIFGRAI
ncbi:hypothetical protein CPB86DRAFT_799298 [Serendipita vermifera]|nr:hypothetical protein CPB86DRAFT_799298 [Serendipita vermifera]